MFLYAFLHIYAILGAATENKKRGRLTALAARLTFSHTNGLNAVSRVK